MMKKNKLKLILIPLTILFLTNCGGVKDALEGKKRSNQSDEFLVKKKNPLQMPPDMKKLPKPGDNFEITDPEEQEEVKNLLKIKEIKDKDENNSVSDLLNNMKKKIQ